jgi:hypothetical protein
MAANEYEMCWFSETLAVLYYKTAGLWTLQQVNLNFTQNNLLILLVEKYSSWGGNKTERNYSWEYGL